MAPNFDIKHSEKLSFYMQGSNIDKTLFFIDGMPIGIRDSHIRMEESESGTDACCCICGLCAHTNFLKTFFF